MVQMRRAFSDTLISVMALGALVLILASLDDRVRDQISMRMAPGQASAQMAGAGVTVSNLTGVVVTAVRDQSIEHSPLVIFVLAAGVLMLFMLRT
jgi:hypothetical protein